MSIGLQTSIFTYEVINDTFTITAAMSLRAVSFLLKSGVGTIQGDLKVGATVSVPLPLDINVPITITSSDSSVLDGVTVDTSGVGYVQIVGKDS